MNNITHLIYDYLLTFGFTESSARYLNLFGLLLILLLIVFLLRNNKDEI